MIAGLGERWSIICRCIEERSHFLQGIRAVSLEQERLLSYLRGLETMLKEMELSHEVETSHLQEQTRRILVSTTNTIYMNIPT